MLQDGKSEVSIVISFSTSGILGKRQQSFAEGQCHLMDFHSSKQSFKQCGLTEFVKYLFGLNVQISKFIGLTLSHVCDLLQREWFKKVLNNLARRRSLLSFNGSLHWKRNLPCEKTKCFVTFVGNRASWNNQNSTNVNLKFRDSSGLHNVLVIHCHN